VQVAAHGEQAVGLAQGGLGRREGGVRRIGQAPGQLAGHAGIVFAVVMVMSGTITLPRQGACE
jgi:hypothetical protein